jgi:3-hydroxybutyryl-CoA dehydrogenase
MEIKQVGIVGCGLMGTEIGYTCAKAGYPVVIFDMNQELVDRGVANIKSLLERMVAKGKLSPEEMQASLGRISGTTAYADFKDCDLVIEAVVEKMEVKKQVFAALDKACKPDAILATNTSSLTVIDMAAATSRMERVLGAHFLPPIALMPLLEMSRTIATSGEAIEAVKKFGESLGLKVFVTKDFPAFVVNNAVVPTILQAVRLLEKEMGTAEEIDQAVMIGAGHRVGPLAMGDYIGLDIILSMAENIYAETKDAVWTPPLLLKKVVAAGWLGRKTGKGFHDYSKPAQ